MLFTLNIFLWGQAVGTAVQGPLLVLIGPGVFPAISESRALVFLSIGYHP